MRAIKTFISVLSLPQRSYFILQKKKKMRKKKSARSNPNNFNSASSSLPEEDEESLKIQIQHNNNNENEISEGEGFFACYLLASLNPRFKGHTYIGFVLNLLKI